MGGPSYNLFKKRLLVVFGFFLLETYNFMDTQGVTLPEGVRGFPLRSDVLDGHVRRRVVKNTKLIFC